MKLFMSRLVLPVSSHSSPCSTACWMLRIKMCGWYWVNCSCQGKVTHLEKKQFSKNAHFSLAPMIVFFKMSIKWVFQDIGQKWSLKDSGTNEISHIPLDLLETAALMISSLCKPTNKTKSWKEKMCPCLLWHDCIKTGVKLRRKFPESHTHSSSDLLAPIYF